MPIVLRVAALALAAALDLGAQPVTPDTIPTIAVTRADLAGGDRRVLSLIDNSKIPRGPQRSRQGAC